MLTVNYHLTKRCNYKCGFCFAHFEDSKELSLDEASSIIFKLAQAGVRKVNFAGGEPFLFKGLSKLLVYTKELGLSTSIITNGSKLNREWIFKYGKYLDIIGISCDSSNPNTLSKLGRGNGNSAQHIKEMFSAIDEFNETTDFKIFKKLNSTITKLNYKENMTDFVRSINPDRWKVFKVLKIEGENDLNFKTYQITDTEFNYFLLEHENVFYTNQKLVAENNLDMTDSYLMLNPEGQFYCNTNGIYKRSDSLLEANFSKALSQINFDKQRFISRGGYYETNT